MKLFEKIKKNIDIYLIREFRIFGKSIFLSVKNTLNGDKRFYFWQKYYRKGLQTKENNYEKTIAENGINDEDFPKISVIVRFIGKNELCERTRLSLLKQTYRNFEVVLVNGGCKSDVFEWEDVIVRNEPALDEGIRNSVGKYIAFCENGDFWSQDHLQKKAEIIRKCRGSAIIVNDIEFYGDENSCRYLNVIADDCRSFFLGADRISDTLWKEHHFMLNLSCCTIKKDCFDTCNFQGVVHESQICQWLLRQVFNNNDFIYFNKKLTFVKASEEKIKKWNADYFYKKLSLVRGDYFLGYKIKTLVRFPDESLNVKRELKKPKIIKKLAIFASYNEKCVIEDYIVYYLKGLCQVVDGIVFVMDNPVLPGEIDKIQKYVIYVQCECHHEYDFGSYKRGWLYLKQTDFFNDIEELILCNDSCYGPFFPLEKVFGEMYARKGDIDFWGIHRNSEIGDHIQSFFYVFRKSVLASPVFDGFLLAVREEIDVLDVVLNYEAGFTSVLEKAGFLWDTYVDYSIINASVEKLVDDVCPLIKVKDVKEIYGKSGRKIRKFRSLMNRVNPELMKIVEKKEEHL